MKLCLLAWPFLSCALVPALAVSSSDTTIDDASIRSPSLAVRDKPQDPKVDVPGGSSTIFNGIDVPPMKALEGFGFEESIKEGYWFGGPAIKIPAIFLPLNHTLMANSTCRFVKHYSPYCLHCTSIAPTWQTLYEFYYVSDTVDLPH